MKKIFIATILFLISFTKVSAHEFNENVFLGTNYKLYTQSDLISLNESGTIELKWLHNMAKPAIVWRDQYGDRKAAIVAHDYSFNDDRPHRHWSVETWYPGDENNPPGLYTRFAVGWGEIKAKIKFSLASVEFGDGVDTTFNASMTQNSPLGFETSSDSDAQITLNRGNTNSDARIKFKSNDAIKWSIGLLDETPDLSFKRVAGGGVKMKINNSGLLVNGDVEADNLILKSPDGSKWMIKVDNNGNIESIKQ